MHYYVAHLYKSLREWFATIKIGEGEMYMSGRQVLVKHQAPAGSRSKRV